MGYWDAVAPSLVLTALAIAFFPWLDRSNTIVRAVTLGLCLVLTWRYMTWRVFNTLPPPTDYLDFAIGALFTSVEALAILGSSISLVFLMRTRDRGQDVDRILANVETDAHAPLVDVLICTYNEEKGILERSIVGAVSMEYSNYRVWVCDDGKREWLQELCRKYDVGYLTRSNNEHAKAGNINAALNVLASLDQPPEFVSILDADFVPLPGFLTRTVALMSQSDVAVVQTPQHFFNSDPIQSNLSIAKVFPDEQRYFFDILMASKDAWGGAFCCGTSSLIRFDALTKIGGFPTDSVTEDYLLSIRFRQQGLQTIYLNEVLSLGLAPEGMAEYIGQRSRWCLGFMQMCRGPSGPLKFNNNLPLIDRIMLIETFLYWSATHCFRMLGLIVPVLYFLFNIQAVHADVLDAIDYALPLFTFQIVTFVWLSKAKVVPIISDLYQVLSAIDIIKSAFAGIVRPNGQKFKVTAKGGDRSAGFVQWKMLRVYLLIIALTVIGIANAFLLDPSRPLAESAGVVLFWCWYNFFILILACFVCIEAPRYRSVDRFQTDELVPLQFNEEWYVFRAIDISIGGMQISGSSPGSVGQKIRVRLRGLNLSAEIIRKSRDSFAVRFEEVQEKRFAMIQHVFSGNYSSNIRDIVPAKVAHAIAAKIFG